MNTASMTSAVHALKWYEENAETVDQHYKAGDDSAAYLHAAAQILRDHPESEHALRYFIRQHAHYVEMHS